MKNPIFISIVFWGILCCNCCTAQSIIEAKKQVTGGGYYFDGWSGLVPNNITPKLTDSFPERKSIWGWVTSDQKIMEKQIDYATDYGLSFFCFDWYFPDS